MPRPNFALASGFASGRWMAERFSNQIMLISTDDPHLGKLADR